jgi:REP element-mobilizing transposase RayT
MTRMYDAFEKQRAIARHSSNRLLRQHPVTTASSSSKPPPQNAANTVTTASSSSAERPPLDAAGSTSPIYKHRGKFLPHWSHHSATYFVTFRLADSIPRDLANQYRDERNRLLAEAEKASGEKRDLLLNQARNVVTGQFDTLLDKGNGAAHFNDPKAAGLVARALTHFDRERYRLWAYCVMPNHVHTVVEPLGNHKLDAILHSWKSYTANDVNKLLKRKGPFWQPDYFDHLIRRQESFEYFVQYTLDNPTKAGLHNWPWRGSY